MKIFKQKKIKKVPEPKKSSQDRVEKILEVELEVAGKIALAKEEAKEKIKYAQREPQALKKRAVINGKNAREELPSRRGYPGYMYSDLASIYERAGRVRGSKGSVTQIILLTMPEDDITHPIPDLTGYITEGQLVLSHTLHQKGISPPIDVLPSLSRLMKDAIGVNHTREDHPSVSNQIYALYAEGRNLEKLVAIVGEGTLTEQDKRVIEFSKQFEEKYLNQGFKNRNIGETLDLAWDLLSMIPRKYLKRIPEKYLDKYYKSDKLSD